MDTITNINLKGTYLSVSCASHSVYRFTSDVYGNYISRIADWLADPYTVAVNGEEPIELALNVNLMKCLVCTYDKSGQLLEDELAVYKYGSLGSLVSHDNIYLNDYSESVGDPILIDIDETRTLNNCIYAELFPDGRITGRWLVLSENNTGVFLELTGAYDETNEMLKLSFAVRCDSIAVQYSASSGNNYVVTGISTSMGGVNYTRTSNPTVTTLTASSSLTSNGTITCSGRCTANNFYATSDLRLKENVSEINLTNIANNLINNLPIYSYNFIADKDKVKNIGIIAQELKELLPEDLQEAFIYEDESGYLKINESKLIYICAAALKEQKQKINLLETKMSELEERLEKLE